MNILLVTATRIGDAVLSSGLIAHYAAKHPGVRITVACGAPAAPLFEAAPGVERVIVIRKRRYHAHWLLLWLGTVGTLWDHAIDLRGSGLSWFLPAKRRTRTKYKDDSVHRVAELGRMLGIDPPPAPAVWPSAEARREAERLVPDGTDVLAVGPAANWGGKQWPADRFAGLVRRATADGGVLPGARVAVLAAEGERASVAPVLAALPADRIVDLVGRPLPVAAAAIARARLFVGNDSGLMHVAAATGTPTLGLFGPSPEKRYGPWGPHCAVVRTVESFEDLCWAPDFDHLSQKTLMGSLTVDMAYEGLAKLYANVKNRT